MHGLDPRGEVESRKLVYVLISSPCLADPSPQVLVIFFFKVRASRTPTTPTCLPIQVRSAAQKTILELTEMQASDQLISIIIAVLALSDRRKTTQSRANSVQLVESVWPW